MCMANANVQMGGKVRKYIEHRSIITEKEAMHVFCFLHVCRKATVGDGTYGYQVLYPFSLLKPQNRIIVPLAVLKEL